MANISKAVKAYIGDLNGGSLLVAETRVIAEATVKGLSEQDWRKLIIEDNVLQKRSAKTASRYAGVVRKRLQPIGDQYIQELLVLSEGAFIQALMVIYLVQSPMVADFMRESLGEARRTYKPTLSADAWAEFFESRVRALPELGNFSPSTVKKMGNNVIKALVECGYLASSRKRIIQPVYLHPEIKEMINSIGREKLIATMECTV